MLSRSAKAPSAANLAAKPLPCAAAWAISRSARNASEACSSAQGSCCTAARTSSRSLRSSSTAKRRALPSCCRAARTTSRSARMASGASQSASASSSTRSIHSAWSGSRRAKVSSRAPQPGRSLSSSGSWHSVVPWIRRCSRRGIDVACSTAPFSLPIVQARLAATLHRCPLRPFTATVMSMPWQSSCHLQQHWCVANELLPNWLRAWARAGLPRLAGRLPAGRAWA
mmetsp:Transcript_30245/g.92915  ORF Transcript_30245/g.92915 Transcript_30245/m.92915 type:complete len:227 (+) Transcript_30245:346-1026(+)